MSNSLNTKHLEVLPDIIPNIVKKRYYIRHKLTNDLAIDLNNLKTQDLRNMFNLYDKTFFGNQFTIMITNGNYKLAFGFLRQSSAIGLFTWTSKDNTCKISICRTAMAKLFINGESRLWVNGLNVRDRLEALQVVFEHEMTHMYMSLKGWSNKIKKGKGKMYYSSHGKLFQELVYRFFLHTDYRHMLDGTDSTGHLTKERCHVGQKVKVVVDKKTYYGVVIKCNPRNAKVQGSGIIWSVPYQYLRSY